MTCYELGRASRSGVGLCVVRALEASNGDSDPIYRSCVEECRRRGCVGKNWYRQEPLYQRWKRWECRHDCEYYCMIAREDERLQLGHSPAKYHGRWPFYRLYGIQEPVSVALAALILAIQFHGWISFLLLVYYYLPLRPQSGKTYYEYTGLWHIYGFMSMNAWLWCAVFRTRDVEFTEKLYCSSHVAWLGFTLVLSTLRAFDIRDEAARIMIAAPVIVFVTSHILYLDLYNFDKGLNTKVTLVMTLVQMLIWVIWVGISRHPSRWKVWVTVLVGGTFAMTLEVYNFPSLQRYVDGRAMWHAAAVPLGYMWWSFVKDDAEFRTSTQVNKAK